MASGSALILGIPNKDAATIVVGAAALVTSISVAVFNWRVQRAKKISDARKGFNEALAGILTARADMEALRHELGDQFVSTKTRQRRVLINGRKSFYLARALVAIRTGGFAMSSADYMLIASALIESGRIAASVEFYEKSFARAEDVFDRASARRVLGRAMLLSGAREQGRDQMLQAIDEFEALAKDHAYDGPKMLRNAADTARRLVAARDAVRWYDKIEDDLSLLERLAETGGKIQRVGADEVSAKVRKRMNAIETEEGGSPTVSE